VAQQPVFRLRIQLKEVHPTVWRRVLVPGGVRLGRLHDIFQAAMGWTNSHLHNFTIGDRLYGTHIDDYPEEELDENEYTVLAALRGGVRRFGYEYDFGDSWEHEVTVEETTWSPLALKHAVCIDGENACPPEDVGGPYGYQQFLEALADPLHEEHDSYLVWVGHKFEADAFDLAVVNAALQRVR
jgi:Plasmid pRiA4b ORF-3-like protein